jgi:uncharacterized protein (UPF0276 family)
LLADAYQRFGPVPTLLERDFNFPPMAELLSEIRQVKAMQAGNEVWKEAASHD